MRRYKGSFTIEAALIFPLVLACIYIAVVSGISMHKEVCIQVEELEKRKPIDMVKCMYRKEFIKDIFGEEYED